MATSVQRRQVAATPGGQIDGETQAQERVFRWIDVDQEVLERHGQHPFAAGRGRLL